MKKILFLSPIPPPYYGSAMSSEACLQILKKAKDFKIKNIKLNYSKKFQDVGKINLSKIKGISDVKKQIKKQILEFRPDTIYFVPATSSLGLYRDYFFVKEIKKLTNKKILFHIRSRIQEKDWGSVLKKRIIKKMFSKQKAIILGKELIKDLHNLIKKENIFILPNAIQNELSKKEFKKMIKNKKNANILFLSNMNTAKGWIKLLEACKILKEKNTIFNCNFVGAWPSKKEKNLFNKLTSKYHLKKHVKYLGEKTGAEKNKILESSSILVFPTEYPQETFGRVNIEAMMFGLPVIANNIATIPSIISHGKTGFILKENSPTEIANYIEELINNSKLRKKMGNNGRKKFLKEFELKHYKKKFLKILHSS